MKKSKIMFCSLIAACIIILFPAAASALSMPSPIISFVDTPTNGSVTVTAAPPEGFPLTEGDAVYYKIADGQWQVYSAPFELEENALVSAKFVSAGGTESQITQVTVSCIDKAPPLPPVITADTSAWSNNRITVSIVGGSDDQSGAARTEYRLEESEEWLEYLGEFAVFSPTVIHARTVDNAGNVSPEALVNLLNFDTTAPDVSGLSVTFGSTGGATTTESGLFRLYFRDTVTVTIDGAQDDQSGVKEYLYQPVPYNALPDAAAWLVYSAEAKPQITADFAGYIYVCAVDNAGNTSRSVSSSGVVFDATAPAIGDIMRSTDAPTAERVIITFSAYDNFAIDSVTVNGEYVGIYEPKFTAYRNGTFVVKATDRAGNETVETIIVDNINTTPYNLLAICQSLIQTEYTPSTWSVMLSAATELSNALTLSADDITVAAATEKLAESMEALVTRGDGTASRELISKFSSGYSGELYTDSSWAGAINNVSLLIECLDNPESTQMDVDLARRELENAISSLKLRGDFTNLDRIMEQARAIDSAACDPVKYADFLAMLKKAESLSRTDTTQQQVDDMYDSIVIAMGRLKPTEKEEGSRISVPFIALLLVFIITAGALVFSFVSKRRQHRDSGCGDPDDFELPDDFNPDTQTSGHSDIYFGDNPPEDGDY